MSLHHRLTLWRSTVVADASYETVTVIDVKLCSHLTFAFAFAFASTLPSSLTLHQWFPNANAQNGSEPFLTFSIDTMLNLMVTLTQTKTQTSSVNTALRVNRPQRDEIDMIDLKHCCTSYCRLCYSREPHVLLSLSSQLPPPNPYPHQQRNDEKWRWQRDWWISGSRGCSSNHAYLLSVFITDDKGLLCVS